VLHPQQGQKNGYGCTGTGVYREKGVYERDVKMTDFWQNDSIVWSEGIKQMDLVIKDGSGGAGTPTSGPTGRSSSRPRCASPWSQVSPAEIHPSLWPNLPAPKGGAGVKRRTGRPASTTRTRAAVSSRRGSANSTVPAQRSGRPEREFPGPLRLPNGVLTCSDRGRLAHGFVVTMK